MPQIPYTPSADDADDNWQGLTLADPRRYFAAKQRRVDARFFFKPLQDTVLKNRRRIAVLEESGSSSTSALLSEVYGRAAMAARFP